MDGLIPLKLRLNGAPSLNRVPSLNGASNLNGGPSLNRIPRLNGVPGGPRRVYLYDPVFSREVVTVAAPPPVFRPLYQSAFHRIPVHIKSFPTYLP